MRSANGSKAASAARPKAASRGSAPATIKALSGPKGFGVNLDAHFHPVGTTERRGTILPLVRNRWGIFIGPSMIQQFYLCRHADGRMVLSDHREGVGATPMSAQPEEGQSAWQAVRARIEEWLYEYRPGYGYYRN